MKCVQKSQISHPDSLMYNENHIKTYGVAMFLIRIHVALYIFAFFLFNAMGMCSIQNIDSIVFTGHLQFPDRIETRLSLYTMLPRCVQRRHN